MKKLLCLLASAALLGACEQRTDVVAPASSPAPEKAVDPNTLSRSQRPAVSTEKKIESSSITTTTSSPTP